MSNTYLLPAAKINGFFGALRAAFDYVRGSLRRWILPAAITAGIQLLALLLTVNGLIGLSDLSNASLDDAASALTALLRVGSVNFIAGIGAFIFGIWFIGITLDRGTPSTVSLTQRVVAYLLTTLLTGLASGVIVGLLFLSNMFGGFFTTPSSNVSPITGIPYLLVTLALIYIIIRLSQIGTAAIALGQPIGAMKTSWAITRGRFWMVALYLIGFGLVSSLASLFLSVPVNLFTGILSSYGGLTAFTGSLISAGLVGLLVTPFTLSLGVILYERLALRMRGCRCSH